MNGKRIFLILPLFILTIFSTKAQNLKSYELIETYAPSSLTSLIPIFINMATEDFPISNDSILNTLDAKFNMDMYKVYYTATHPVHGEIDATGAVVIPKGAACGMPMAVYQHGTTFNWDGVPSYKSQEHFLGCIFASSGYITLMPDYLGLGDSPHMHPYSHAQSTANAGRDLMRAVKEMQEELDFVWNEEVFITGYSQGGHGAMALFKSLEEDHSDEFTVTACSPLSGAYDISGEQESVMWEPYDYQRYLPYVLVGYQSVYPTLLGDYKEIFKEEYSALNNFTGDTKAFFEAINPLNLPDTPVHMIKDELLEEYINDENHPLREAMKDNDNYDWTPKAPLLIQGCCDDEQVKYTNSTKCYDTMIENGVQDITLVDYCKEYPEIEKLGHGGCVPFCLIATKDFFDSKSTRCDVVGINDADNKAVVDLNIYPNPVVSGFTVLQSDLFTNEMVTLNLYDAQGRQVFSKNTGLFSGTLEVDLSAYENGFYSFQMKSENRIGSIPFFIQQ